MAAPLAVRQRRGAALRVMFAVVGLRRDESAGGIVDPGAALSGNWGAEPISASAISAFRVFEDSVLRPTITLVDDTRFPVPTADFWPANARGALRPDRRFTRADLLTRSNDRSFMVTTAYPLKDQRRSRPRSLKLHLSAISTVLKVMIAIMITRPSA
jgi:hypothetical protein